MATRTMALSTMILATTACGDVAPLGSGELALEWSVNPNGCEAAGVEQVEVHASGPHAVVERYDCDAGSAVLRDVTPGIYRVELRGFDDARNATFTSDAVSVEVRSEAVAQPAPIRLRAAPADIQVRWSFDNGRVCGANGARLVELIAFDEFDYDVGSATFPCDSGEGRLPPLRAGSYIVEVSAYDDDVTTWRGTTPVKVSRADQVTIDVELIRAE